MHISVFLCKQTHVELIPHGNSCHNEKNLIYLLSVGGRVGSMEQVKFTYKNVRVLAK